jgi:hypothetical protein
VPLDKAATWINIFIAIIVEGLLIYSIRMEMEQALEEKPVEEKAGNKPKDEEDEDELFEQMMKDIDNGKSYSESVAANKLGGIYSSVNPLRR